MMTEPYDVAVIGAGVIGSAIACRLARESLRILWLEGAYDVCEGASKANSGIAITGWDCAPGTLETELVLASRGRWEQLVADLDVPFRRIGELVLAFSEDEERRLEALLEQAARNDVVAQILDGREAARIAPAISPQTRAALHIPDEAIIDPLRLTIGYAEAAVSNGVELRLCTPATGFRRNADGLISEVRAGEERFPVRYVVNAAGLFADEVSSFAGAEAFRMWPRKGQFLLMDREVGSALNKILVPVPTEHTRGILVIPTTNGGLLLGPTAEDGEDKVDKSTDPATLDHVFTQAGRLLPGLQRSRVIKTFAGLRPASDHVYRLERSAAVPNLIQAAGIRSTGVSASPGVADFVFSLLQQAGLETRPRASMITRLPRANRMTNLPGIEEPDGAGLQPDEILVCACEHVTATQIKGALTSSVPARTIAAVRKRTRASGGRCQGGFCTGGIGFMLSVAHGYSAWEVPQEGPGSSWGVAMVSDAREGGDDGSSKRSESSRHE